MKKDKIGMNSFKVVILALILTVGFQQAVAQTSWRAPTSAPPAGNTYAPLNVGSSAQEKTGILSLTVGVGTGLLIPSGNIGMGFRNLTGSAIPPRIDMYGPNTQRLLIESSNDGAARVDMKSGTNAWHMESYLNQFHIVESGAATRLSMARGGNVGIGTGDTVDPNARLSVAGKVKIVDGSEANNRVLTSDATGLGTWKDPRVPVVTTVGNLQGNPSYHSINSSGSDQQDIMCPGNQVMTGVRTKDFDDSNQTSARIQGIYCKTVRVQ